MQSPYDAHPGEEEFAAPPAPEYGGLSRLLLLLKAAF